MTCPARKFESGVMLAAAIGLLMLLCAGSVAAQSSATADTATRYRVEVVLFTQPPMDDRRRENPEAEPIPLPGRMAWPLRGDDNGLLGYRQLPAGSHVLGQAARRIEARAGFDVLWHAAWVQPGLGPDQARAVALPPRLRREGLSGSVRVYRQRFLHVEAELRYAESEDRHWAMSSSRRMRSNQQHYLDHPVLGMLVRIDEVRDDSAANQSSSSG